MAEAGGLSVGSVAAEQAMDGTIQTQDDARYGAIPSRVPASASASEKGIIMVLALLLVWYG
jgi:hypothetical protein